MDPATAGGLAVGIASLAFDVFDNSVKLFKFLSSMVDMPKECEQCRLQLMIEYNRLLAWGESVGLIDVPQGSHVAVSLGTNAIELCSIVSRIGWLLGEFRDINARWKNELHPYQGNDQETTEINAMDMDVVKEVSSLAIAYERTKEERKHLRGTNHIIKWMSKGAGNAKEIITHPFRVRWVMVDKEAFEALLKDLHSLTERIHELMGDYREKRIHETTSKTYREMVLARNDINELKDLFEAVTSLIKSSKDTGDANTACHNENDETLRDLLRLKEINCISDEILLKIENDVSLDIEKDLKDLLSVNRYDAITLSDHFTYAEAEGTKDLSKPHRPRGVLTKDGTDFEVWIEWRTVDNVVKGSVQDKESRLRTATLAQMLHNNKPRHLYSPICIGYIDDRERHNRYGWIFRMPDGSDKGTTLKTLHSVLGQNQHKPTLAQRISLAWKLASSLLYLHTTNWLHKGIHSGNVIFSFDGDKFDAEKPILSGFEYSRPQSNKTTSRSLDPKWDIYRWPGIQNEVPKAANSRKTYDIYSLGLVLLEIAHWKPLHKLMFLKRWPEPSAQDSKIRAWLLEEERRPPFKDSNPLLELRNIAGDKYWKAVSRCLVAHGNMGMHIQEESHQSQGSGVGIELQNAFTELVVEELKGVSI
ncbi:prion-inhibition and propagation-domain-containing protein [Ilyonectria robusta]|uniref:prion-inhibition and propagation-domain-containing protein n=1 Tax=Ilyonectria robusta TaxID=1079257 RepID=UPI001E8D78DA|nr:prion-inhibition and propagation-domain-containing protein [Ilyonectria robusta]KAH8662766.1 prion-inhibition and propagation-domain-containing protein [Ilyonectria robusta]